MAITTHIQIARGQGVPSINDLEKDGELGYDKKNRQLYINNNQTIDLISGSDIKVEQNRSTEDNIYRILLTSKPGKGITSPGAETSIVNENIYANPSSGLLHAKQFEGNGAIVLGNREPENSPYNFWLDTSNTEAVPEGYQVKNGLDAEESGKYVLDAYQGRWLNEKFIEQIDDLATISLKVGESRELGIHSVCVGFTDGADNHKRLMCAITPPFWVRNSTNNKKYSVEMTTTVGSVVNIGTPTKIELGNLNYGIIKCTLSFNSDDRQKIANAGAYLWSDGVIKITRTA